MDVLRLFQEQGAVDELGIGIIRDGFANYFFPVTSTIQIRARYFFIIPYAMMDTVTDPRVTSVPRCPRGMRDIVGAKGGTASGAPTTSCPDGPTPGPCGGDCRSGSAMTIILDCRSGPAMTKNRRVHRLPIGAGNDVRSGPAMTEEMPDQVGHDDIGKVGHDEIWLNYVGVSDEGLT